MAGSHSERVRRSALPEGVEVLAPVTGRFGEILTPEALEFVAKLQREFNPRREALLAARAERRERILAGETPGFLTETRGVREAEWKVASVPKDLQDRKVEITGPVDRKMMINALNSGASVFMADFEDANSPTWEGVVQGHVNLIDAIERTIDYVNPDGRAYRLHEKTATLLVRPRGWHLVEKHVRVDGADVAGGLIDFGLYMFHNARRLLEHGTGPYFYLPKLQSHREARLWNDVFCYTEDALGVPRGCVKATVLIEHVLAAFEMEEILYELRDHSGGLNAGRWDYIYSFIKTFHNRPGFLFPDRAQVTMAVPFMRAYTQLLVRTCHARGAFAVGGMAAFIPSRRDPEVNRVALDKVREDKVREAGDGFDGTWVAHPDLVPAAKTVFDEVLGDRPNQVERQRPDVSAEAKDLLDVRVPGGEVTEGGVRNNISVAIQYVESWLRGVGAAAIYNLMEDAATAEIARSQIWQWVHHGARLADGRSVDRAMVRAMVEEEMARLETGTAGRGRRFDEARALFEETALSPSFVEFLTIPAYAHLA